MRRELGTALVLCLAGAALLLLSAGRTWVGGTVPQPPPLPDEVLALRGSEVLGALRPLALAALAGLAGLAATRGRGRAAVGAVLALVGAAAVAGSLTAAGARADETGGSPTGWPWVAVLGGLLVLASGVLVAVRGRRWAGLSRRYDAPSARPVEGERELWEALDRGEDPTSR